MSGRFEEFEIKPAKVENCNTCESYYMGACDGLRGHCQSYKQYRVRTLEELVKIAIGITVVCNFVTWLLLIIISWC